MKVPGIDRHTCSYYLGMGHGQRFAHQTLPEHIFDNPLAFARAVEHPRRRTAVLSTTWERAGALLPVDERRAPTGLEAKLVRVDGYVVIHVAPPFASEPGDPCAIAVVGRGDGEHELENVSYYVVEPRRDEATGATRFVLVSRSPASDEATEIGEAAIDVDGLVAQCVELAAGIRPSQRDLASRAIAPWYWWHVYRGAEMMALFHGTPESDAWSVVHQHPILLLPELVDAAEQALGVTHAIAGLRQMHASLRDSPYFAPFQLLLANTLGNEASGSQRVNVERALAVIADLRARGIDCPVDVDACEAVLHGKLARGSSIDLASSIDPTWSALFLDDIDLRGYLRGEDRRGGSPQPHERAFTVHGGLEAGHTAWVGNDGWPVHRIVDARWMFATVKAASAFVHAIQPRAAEGLPGVAAPPVGDAAHAWGGVHPDTGLATQILLVRIGRVVAKLVVVEGPKARQSFQSLDATMLRPYADTIVKRARWALARYWLAVCRGSEAANVFAQTPARTTGPLFSRYPILLLPEFPSAMACLGEPQRNAAEALCAAQAKLKNSWQAYRDVVRALVRALLDERAGDARVNADAALAIVVEHRRHDPDYAWAAVEAECRARLTAPSSGRRP